MLAICLDDCAGDLDGWLCAGSPGVDGSRVMPMPCVTRVSHRRAMPAEEDHGRREMRRDERKVELTSTAMNGWTCDEDPGIHRPRHVGR